jgi:membrane-bound lytic murein transglycosylase B
MNRKTISAEEFDRLFDEGSDEIDQYIDWTLVRRHDEGIVRVDLDLPERMAAKLEAAAEQSGVPREQLIRMWLSERLNQATETSAGTSAAA